MLFYNFACFTRKQNLYFLYVCAFVIIMMMGITISKWIILTLKQGYFVETQELACHDVLTNMVRGQWMTRNFRQAELHEIETYKNKTLTYKTIPRTLQRKDGRCGELFLTKYI